MNKNIIHYCHKWGLTIEKEINTPSSIVCVGQQGNLPVVLKMPRPGSDEMGQNDSLAYFNGHGAVRVLNTDGLVILLERLSPGNHLVELTQTGRDDEATRIFCQIAGQLHQAKGSLQNFRSIAELAQGFERYLRGDNTQIPVAEVLLAKEVYDLLLASQADPVLLHGDLHHDNILHDDTRGWVAIDPKGYVGEPMYEAGAWLRNPMQSPQHFASHEIVERRISIMVNELGWNRERLLKWGYAQAILSAIWAIEDDEKPDAPLAISRVMREMM